MNDSPFDRYLKGRRPDRERRFGLRDRRLLEGTMKYRGHFALIEVVDLSETGAYVIGPEVPELADCVTLTIKLPSVGGTVMVTGRVRRVTLGSRVLSRAGGFGVEFTRFYTRPGRESLQLHLAA